MKIASTLLLALAPLFLTGCAAPRADSAPPRAGGYVLTSSSYLAQVNDTTQLLDREESVLYFQNEGGDLVHQQRRAATPAGDRADAVGSATRREAALLFGKTGFRLRDAFAEAAKKASLNLATVPLVQAPKITPYLHVVKTEDNTLRTAAALLVEELRGPDTLRTRYVVQLVPAYSVEGLSQLSSGQASELRTAVVDGFATLIRRLQADDAGVHRQEPKIVFTSDFLTPRLNLLRPGSLIEDDGQQVWVRSRDGVFGLRKAQILYSPAPPQP
jgi:hypothetical protein